VADLGVETTLRLAQVPRIVGLKDATGDLARAGQLLRRLPASFALYSGNDDSALALLLLGGHGVVSVTANVAPKLMRQMCDAALSSDLPKARALNGRLMPLHTRLFVEPNPIPVKWALQRMGKIAGGIRLPLVPLSAAGREAVQAALDEVGVA
jgi:4-hydroxy-tetrahydrodipicolinate synthase